jgi:hypothetical protein
MKLRRFNGQGIAEFRVRLAVLRGQPDCDPPLDLLEHSQFTEIVNPEVNVGDEYFETKGVAATYLRSILGRLNPEEVAQDAGLWTWLSLKFFDSVCPVADKVRLVKNDYHYVYEPKNSRYFYRHLLFVSWQILRLAPKFNRVFVKSPVSVLDAFTTEVMKRLFLTRIPCIFEVLERLYFDERRGKVRRGVTSGKSTAGNLRHRLPLRISQLEKNYDLLTLNADQLLELLGEEFAFASEAHRTLFDAQGDR